MKLMTIARRERPVMRSVRCSFLLSTTITSPGENGQQPIAHVEEPVAGDADEDLQPLVPVRRTRIGRVRERVELDEERKVPIHGRIVAPRRIEPLVDDAGLERQLARNHDGHDAAQPMLSKRCQPWLLHPDWTFPSERLGRILQIYDEIMWPILRIMTSL